MQKTNSSLETKTLHLIYHLSKQGKYMHIYELAYLFVFEIFIHSFLTYLWTISIMSGTETVARDTKTNSFSQRAENLKRRQSSQQIVTMEYKNASSTEAATTEYHRTE